MSRTIRGKTPDNLVVTLELDGDKVTDIQLPNSYVSLPNGGYKVRASTDSQGTEPRAVERSGVGHYLQIYPIEELERGDDAVPHYILEIIPNDLPIEPKPQSGDFDFGYRPDGW